MYLQCAGSPETLQASSPSRVCQECNAPYAALRPLNIRTHFCEPMSMCLGSPRHMTAAAWSLYNNHPNCDYIFAIHTTWQSTAITLSEQSKHVSYCTNFLCKTNFPKFSSYPSTFHRQYLKLLNTKWIKKLQKHDFWICKMSYMVFFNSLGSQVKACYANTGHVLWMSLQNTHTTKCC